MVVRGVCRAAALRSACFFTVGSTVVEADASSGRAPEVLARAGRRAGGVFRNVQVGSAAQGQTHPWIIITMVVFALLAFLIAICIAKRYCFPQGNQTYTYSILRRYEEFNLRDENTQSRQQLDSSESDQDLRE